MKCEDNNLLRKISKLKWRVKSFSTDKKCTDKNLSYEEGDFFHFKVMNEESDKETLGGITLYKPLEDITINMDFFFAIKPTWFIRDNVFYLTAFIGNDPCALHRLVMWFENVESDNPTFHFETIPMYDDCVCDHFDPIILYISSHGIGDGTGEIK